MIYKLLAVGTDTEVFWKNKSTGDPIPSIGLLPGTKEAPSPISQLGEGFTIQEDNVMPEFGIPPAQTAEEFSANITKMLNWLTDTGAVLDLDVDISPARFFLPSQLFHPQAQEFGCTPDFCVWNRQKNRVNFHTASQLRTAGGHIHISFTVDEKVPEIVDMEKIVKFCDLAFLPLLFIDTDVFRRLLYGRAGAWRSKEYSPTISGVEYRTLSNLWITSPTLTKYIFTQINWIFSKIDSFEDYFYSGSVLEQYLPSIINNRKLNEAQKLIVDYRIPYPRELDINVESNNS